MTAKDNIVPLDPAKFEANSRAAKNAPASVRTAAITRRMSAPAIQVKELLNRHLGKHLQSLFDHVDDALFDLAENAPSNQQQNVFFESMREVRFKRVEIERDFLEQVQKGFVQLFSDSAQGDNGADSFSLGDSTDSLAIMDEDVVEEMVAIDGMVAKFEKLLAGPIGALDARLAHLAGVEVGRFGGGQPLNPVTPKKLCHYFANACHILSIDIKARIVVFKLFEKILLSGLEQIYKQANEKLIRANVLPDFRGSLQGGRAPAPPNNAGPADVPQEHAQLSERAMSVVEAQQAHELARLMTYVPAYGNSISGTQAGTLSGSLQLLRTSDYPVIGNETLLQLLHNLQRQQGAGTAASASDAALLAMQRPEDVVLNLATKLAAAADNGEHSIGQRERDVIGLVSMLFQFVLEDRVVSAPMKAAISRLQVPIIKVALNESNFFCSPSHPARRLLNEMTQAVLGWVATDNYHTDPLYQLICGTVERVTREYEDDSQIFFELMADLKSWVDGDNKRTDLRKKRLVDAESGRDESATARAAVKAVVEQQMLPGIPDFVAGLVATSWSNILFLVYLQKGQQSPEWKNALATLQELLWTVAPTRSRSDRAELLDKLPGLLKALREGLESVNHDKRAVAEFFSQLERTHMQVMQRAEPLAGADLAAEVTPRSAAPAAVKPAIVASVQATDVPGLAKATALTVGQWVEIRDGDDKKRCRLVAILRNSGKRIFINRTGSKAAELEVEEIADMLSQDKMILLEDAQLFDKALTSIIDGLRKQQHVAIGA